MPEFALGYSGFVRLIKMDMSCVTTSSHQSLPCMSVSLPVKVRGQVMIVMLVFAAMLGAALLSIYNVSKLTTTKQQLTDAADAAAYSGATVLAQGLNYVAYTNRAIMLNSSLQAQMVGMRSTLSMSQWYWKNTKNALSVIESLALLVPPALPAVRAVSEPLKKFADTWGNKVVYAMRGLAEALEMTGASTLALTNQVMWAAQHVQLAQSVAIYESTLLQVAKDNAPNAEIDLGVHMVFGPFIGGATLYQTLKPLVRKGKRTQGEGSQSLDDEYLQFFTEHNRAVWTPAVISARTYLPNAVGLWIAKGCDAPLVDMLSGAFVPPSGLGVMEEVLGAVSLVKGVLSPLANRLMCMTERGGGTELIQDKDGHMAWAAIDTMAFKWTGMVDLLFGQSIAADVTQNVWTKGTGDSDFESKKQGFNKLSQILDLILNVFKIPTRIPFAGGSVISFSDKNDAKGEVPESLRHFLNAMKDNRLDSTSIRTTPLSARIKHNEEVYFGSKVNLEADCVEQLIGGKFYAASSSTKIDTPCVVLSTGSKDTGDTALWGGRLNLGASAEKTLAGKNFENNTASLSSLANQLAGSMGSIPAQFASTFNGVTFDRSSDTPVGMLGNMAPAGIDGAAGPTTTGAMNPAAIASFGQMFKNQLGNAGAAARGFLTSAKSVLNPSPAMLGSLINPQNFLANLMNNPASADNPHGNNLGWLLDFVLMALGLDDFKDALSSLIGGQISDGVETPRFAPMNAAMRALSSGLPPWFWDVRIDKMEDAPAGFPTLKYDFKVDDDDKKDYHPRRRGYGPLVYVPLIQSNDQIKTAQKIPSGGEKIGLPDFTGGKNGMKAMGKARVYYRSPGEQWTTRYKYLMTSNMLIPNWSVRNESLSYADKAGLLALDGLTTVTGEMGSE